MTITHKFASEVSTIARSDSVAGESYEFIRMKQDWELPEALLGGTKEMRKKGKKYLPQNPQEEDVLYQNRLNRTFLYNAYKRSVTTLASQPFIKPVQVSNVPSELEYLEHDADGTGRSLTEIAHDMLFRQLHYGLAHNLVDNPRVEGPISIADAGRLNIRPYFNPIDPTEMHYFQGKRIGGIDHIEEIRFREVTLERVEGSWLEDYVHRVRVITPDSYETYILSHQVKESFEIEHSSDNPLGYVPLVTAYGNRTGFLTAASPLEDLAWLNLRHWQTTSEQNNILHVVRVPILMFKGVENEKLEGVAIGGNMGINFSSVNADGKFIEHTGNAVEAGRTDRKDLENQMHEMGADLLVTKSVARQTATARKIDQSQSLSPLQQMIRNLETTLQRSYMIAGEWLDIDASDVEVHIGDDLSVPVLDDSTNKELRTLRDEGSIDQREFIMEHRRRGTISATVGNEEARINQTTEVEIEDETLEVDEPTE